MHFISQNSNKMSTTTSVIIGLVITFLLGGIQAIYPSLSGLPMVISQAIVLILTYFAHQNAVQVAVGKAKAEVMSAQQVQAKVG
jgi:hypothetical protein